MQNIHLDICRNTFLGCRRPSGCFACDFCSPLWLSCMLLCSPLVSTTLKSLSGLYRRQGKVEAADALEECLSRMRKPVSMDSVHADVHCAYFDLC